MELDRFICSKLYFSLLQAMRKNQHKNIIYFILYEFNLLKEMQKTEQTVTAKTAMLLQF